MGMSGSRPDPVCPSKSLSHSSQGMLHIRVWRELALRGALQILVVIGGKEESKGVGWEERRRRRETEIVKGRTDDSCQRETTRERGRIHGV